MALNRKKIEKLSAICILTAFMGQLYLNPFSTGFRFSFSVVILSLLLVYFKDISIITATNAVGITIALFRIFVYITGNPSATWLEGILEYYPVAIFYILYGILFELLNVRDKIKKPALYLISLWACDTLSNIVEVVLRKEWTVYPFEGVIFVIILMGLLRAFIIICIYYISEYYLSRYEREQKENKYREMVLFIASLKAELFFLRKSMVDIENAMNKSYMLYEELQDASLKDKALLVAKDIHEIKKDYLRVVTGIEKTLLEENKNLYMNIRDIFTIIKANTQKLIEAKNKEIILRFKYTWNFTTRDFYQIISVLNNLIINGIEAIEGEGVITVYQTVENDKCIFKVEDNGKGIDPDEIDLIFEPGFSTKFNPVTGEMSTGIGLTHVKHIIEQHFQGTIHVHCEKNIKTVFEIIIPLKNIMHRKW